jgi:hypothetical protein
MGEFNRGSGTKTKDTQSKTLLVKGKQKRLKAIKDWIGPPPQIHV